ncbi:MAG: S41 family peptidase [Chloroflexi bacterium]|nr:S41 family peptidase [Chloroflexota bacterium]
MRIPHRRAILAACAVAAVVALAVTACGSFRTSGNSTTPGGVPKDLAKVWEAYDVLKKNYVDQSKVNPAILTDAAARAMIQALNDPFSAYYTKAEYQSAFDSIEGQFQGIGGQLTSKDGVVVIDSTVPGAPAEKAGLMAGDVIKRIEGKEVGEQSLDEVIKQIRGPKGTIVHLQVLRPSTSQTLDFAIVRDDIKTVTVTTTILKDGIALLHISQFAAPTSEDFGKALDQLTAQQMKGLVLDLRDDPGGLVPTVVDVASQFLKDGLVLYEINAAGKRTDWKVSGGGKALNVPLVVLVNHGSASGSEVLSGALQDQGRAKIIGAQTYGKGVVNQRIQLTDGSGLLISTAKWYTPNGHQITQKGITPDIVVDRTADDITAKRDPQLDKALQVLQGRASTSALLEAVSGAA